MKYDPLMDSDKINDQNKLEAARRFLDNITWIYENIQERGNAPRDGRHNRITFRRFAPGAPQSCIREVLDLLTQQAPYQDPVVSNAVVPGKWKPKLSWFRKDSRYETVNNKTASVTLIQDLVPADEDGDSEAFYGGGDCFKEISYQYFWDASEVIVPEKEVGVLYSAGGVSRDDESGLFSYYVSKQVSIEHHEEPYVARIQNSSVVWVETWQNMRDLPEGLPEDDKVEIDGKVIEVSRKRNEDCTWDITKQTTETLEHDALEACKKTITEHQHTTQTGGNNTPLSEAPMAGSGKYYEYSSKKEEDGTYTHSKTVTNEISVSEVSVSKEGSLYGTRVTTQSKNQQSPPTGEPGIGETIQYSKTPGGRYDVTKVCVIVTNPECTEDTRQATISENVCSVTATEKEKGECQATAENGTRVAHSYNMNQYGTWEHKVTTTTEKPVSECMITKSMGVDGVTMQWTDINQPAGTQWEVSKVGESVRVEKTPGGLINITKTTIDVNTDIVKEVSDSETIFQDTHRKTTVKAVPIAGLDGPGSYKDAGGGKVYAGSSTLLDSGAYQNSEATTTEYSVSCAVERVSKNVFGTEKTTQHRSQKTACTYSGKAKDVSVTNSKTDGGWYNVEITETERCTVDWGNLSKKTVFEEERTYITRAADRTVDAGVGETVSAVMGDDGKYDITRQVSTPLTQTWNFSSDAQGDGRRTEVIVVKNSPTRAPHVEAPVGTAVQVHETLNEYGRYDYQIQTTTAPEAWVCSIFLPHDGAGTYFTFFKNAGVIPEPEYSGNVSSASASVSLNSFGTYDGSFSVTFEDKDSATKPKPPGTDDDGDDDSDPETPPSSDTSCSTTLGNATLSDWGTCGTTVRTKTTEVYNGIAYDVIWEAEMSAGFKTNGSDVSMANGYISMPGGPAGGVYPFSSGAYYMFYSEPKRISVSAASCTMDDNGAPVVSSGS